MTTTRYFVARIAQAFGIFRRPQRMGDAASEMHLLREAETQLGMAVWQQVDSIERLSIEYWNLRKLVTERDAISERIADCERRLSLAHEERSNLINAAPVQQAELTEMQVGVLNQLEQLTYKRDKVVSKARNVRRVYEGLQIKLEFLLREKNQTPDGLASLEAVRHRLAELKQEFAALKDERTQIGAEIETNDIKLDQIEQELESLRKERNAQAAAAFQVIGEANKELSVLRAERGVLETRMRQLYGEIGRYMSRQAFVDSHCAQAVKTHHGLIEVMRALRRSIALNHRLAGLS